MKISCKNTYHLQIIGLSLWSNLPRSMKRTTILNTFKQPEKAISWQFSWNLGLIGL